MGEWIYKDDYEDEILCEGHGQLETLKDAMIAHNADCDEYEARIAELEAMLADEVAENVRLRSREVGDEVGNLLQEVADLKNELARVKAESLRVVESECQDMNIASDWYMTPDGLGWLGYDRRDCECVETPHGYNKFDECKKVRLERWEDEG